MSGSHNRKNADPDKLPSVRVLGLVAVDRAELEAWIDRHRVTERRAS